MPETTSDPIPPAHWHLPHVVQALRESREVTHRVRHQGRLRELPSREALTAVMQGLSAALFPTHYGRPDLTDDSIDFFVGHTLHDTLGTLADQVRRALKFATTVGSPGEAALADQAVGIVQALAEQLPALRGVLFSDLQAAWHGDPAATGMSEILLCYPGITAIVHHRIAHALYRLGTPLLARLIADIAHARTGIDIHPGAQIGQGFFIDHGTGVVIGETCVIGQNVRLYQAVTLGAKRFPADDNGHLLKGLPRHPIVEDDVVIYAGATVLGRITIGRGSTIGGNVWLTQSVPPHSNVSQALSRQA
ncbi:MAG: serine acetyltransferase [Proteobacteria bacterium]|uniref:serine O-acetyltransferase EpsC n=1 Tax=Aquabacterium sp. TaxID=1872578 RepID=UPI0035C711D1|nr:serine acetyltransferase [Pseudomonadota bacterium]